MGVSAAPGETSLFWCWRRRSCGSVREPLPALPKNAVQEFAEVECSTNKRRICSLVQERPRARVSVAVRLGWGGQEKRNSKQHDSCRVCQSIPVDLQHGRVGPHRSLLLPTNDRPKAVKHLGKSDAFNKIFAK